MHDDISDIREYYDSSVENEDGRLERHPVERDITWRYLNRFLPRSGKLLEIGAATGAYTIPLAEKGYEITAVDLSSSLLEKCREKVLERGLRNRVECVAADARNLSDIQSTDYDAVLLMGPLYHLSDENDRLSVIRQVSERLKPGGRIFSSFISRYGIWRDILVKSPQLIKYPEDVRSVLETGKDLVVPSWNSQFRAYFVTVPEIEPLHARFGFRTLALTGIELIPDEAYEKLSADERRLWLDLLVRIGTEPSVIGNSCHILYIGEKPA